MMNDYKLIELVRKNPVLYDVSHLRFKDSPYKRDLWNKIGSQVNLDGTTSRKRWNNIRDTYRKSLKKTEQNTKVKFYKFSEQLNFLYKYFKEPPTATSPVANEETDENTVFMDENEVYFGISSNDASSPSRSDLVTSPSPSPTFLSNPTTSTSKKRKYSKTYPQNNQAKIERNQDPIDAFLNGIAPTLKSLHPYYLNLAKSEIFATVQKYEMEMMTTEEPKYSHTMDPISQSDD